MATALGVVLLTAFAPVNAESTTATFGRLRPDARHDPTSSLASVRGIGLLPPRSLVLAAEADPTPTPEQTPTPTPEPTPEPTPTPTPQPTPTPNPTPTHTPS
jgi:outer membrane biosynthesis protein TonB